MREGDPRIAVAESGRHLEALLCASPILICPTRHDPCPVNPPDHERRRRHLVQVKLKNRPLDVMEPSRIGARRVWARGGRASQKTLLISGFQPYGEPASALPFFHFRSPN